MRRFLEKNDWQTKLRLLWAGGLAFMLICYQIAIKPTLQAKQEYGALQAGELSRQADLAELDALREKARRVNYFLGVDDRDAGAGVGITEPERIAQYARQFGANVRNLPPPEEIGNETIRLLYAQYELEGSFVDLLRTLHAIERQGHIQLLGASFAKMPNPATRTPELLLQLQTIRIE